MMHYYDITAHDRNGNLVFFRNVQLPKLIGFDNYFSNKQYKDAIFYYKPAASSHHPGINGITYFVIAGSWDQENGYKLLYDPRNTPSAKSLRGKSNYIFGPYFSARHFRKTDSFFRRWW